MLRAAARGNVDKVKAYLNSKPTSILEVDNFGNTALLAAVERQQVDCALILIQGGIDVDAVNKVK
jgi:ankyrin repeat protein